MLNVLIPMSGKIAYDSPEFNYPKPLVEIAGKSMIERLFECFNQIEAEKRFIFIMNSEDSQKYKLGNMLKLMTDGKCIVIELEKATRGAACSVLMAAEHVNTDDALIISNCDHIFEINLNTAYSFLRDSKFDAGTICFQSVHPKWSYVRLDDQGMIIEAAEKCPISKNAIAGFYYFRHGRDFVEAAMKSILKGADVDGSFYVAPVFNELVLENKVMGVYHIKNDQYFNFYSPHKLRDYEAHLNSKAKDGQ